MTLLLFFFFLQNQSIALTWSVDDLMPPTERHIFSFNSKEELKKWHLYSDSEYGGIYILNCKSPLHSYVWSYAQYAKKELIKLMCGYLNIICECQSFIFFLSMDSTKHFLLLMKPTQLQTSPGSMPSVNIKLRSGLHFIYIWE